MLLKSKNVSRGKFLNLQIASKTFTSIDTSTKDICESLSSDIFANTKYYLLGYQNSKIRIYKPKGKIMIDQSSATVAPLTKFPNQIFVAVAVLCIRGSLAVSLASTHQTPVAPLPSPTCDNQKCLQHNQMFYGEQYPPVLLTGNHQFRL